MSRLIAAASAACRRFSRPPRKPLKQCACGTQNEPERTSCIGCGAHF